MKLIKTDSGIIAVSEEQPVKGDYFDTFIGKIRNTNGAEYSNSDITKQIIAGTPNTLKLKFSPEVSEVLGVFDAKEEAILEYGGVPTELSRSKRAYIKGFTRHAELNKERLFTEKDIIGALGLYRELGVNVDKTLKENLDKLKNDIVQSLREFEIADFEQSEDTLTILKLK